MFINEGGARQLVPEFLPFGGHKPWIVKEFIPSPTHCPDDKAQKL